MKITSSVKCVTSNDVKMCGYYVPKATENMSTPAFKWYHDIRAHPGFEKAIRVPCIITVDNGSDNKYRLNRKGKRIGKKKAILPKGWTQLIETVPWCDVKDANAYAILTGPKTNIMVLDIDREHTDVEITVGGEKRTVVLEGREALLHLWLALTLCETFKVRTPSGGMHIYFIYNPAVRSRVGLEWNDKDYGVDLMSNGRCIFGPGSYNPIYDKYYEVEDNSPIAECPDHILKLLIHWTLDKEGYPTVNKELTKAKIQFTCTEAEMKQLLSIAPLGSFYKKSKWYLLACALKSAGFSFDLFHWFSRDIAGNYKSEADCQKCWEKAEVRPVGAGGVGIGSVMFWIKKLNPDGYKCFKKSNMFVVQPKYEVFTDCEAWQRKSKLKSNDYEANLLGLKEICSHFYYCCSQGDEPTFYYYAANGDDETVLNFVRSKDVKIKKLLDGFKVKVKKEDCDEGPKNEPKFISMYQKGFMNEVGHVINEPGTPTLFRRNGKLILNIFNKSPFTREYYLNWRANVADPLILKETDAWLEYHFLNVVCNGHMGDWNFRYQVNSHILFGDGTYKIQTPLDWGKEGGEGKGKTTEMIFYGHFSGLYTPVTLSKLDENGGLDMITEKRLMVDEEVEVDETQTECYALVKKVLGGVNIPVKRMCENRKTEKIYINAVLMSNKQKPLPWDDSSDRRFAFFRWNCTKIPGFHVKEERHKYFRPLYTYDWRYFTSYFALRFDKDYIPCDYKTVTDIEYLQDRMTRYHKFIIQSYIPLYGNHTIPNGEYRVTWTDELYNFFKKWHLMTFPSTEANKILGKDKFYSNLCADLITATPDNKPIKVQGTRGTKRGFQVESRDSVIEFLGRKYPYFDLEIGDTCRCGLAKIKYICDTHNVSLCHDCCYQHTKDEEIKCDLEDIEPDMLLTDKMKTQSLKQYIKKESPH